MSIAWGAFETVITAIDIIFYFSILNIQLGLKNWVKRNHIVIYGAFLLAVLLIYNYFTQNHYSSIIIANTVLVAYAGVFIRGKWIFKIFWIFLSISFLLCVEMMSLSFLLIINPETMLVDFALHGLYRLQLAAVAIPAQLISLFFILKIRLHLEQFAYTLLLPLAASHLLSSGLILVLTVSALEGEIVAPIFSFFAALVLLVINLTVLFLITLINKKNAIILEHEIQAQRKLMEHEMQMQMQLMEHEIQTQKQEHKVKNLERLLVTAEKYEEFREFIDAILADLWDIMKAVRSPKGGREQIAKYESIIQQIAEVKGKYNFTYFTGDDVLDMVLLSRDNLAQKKNIKMKLNIDSVPEQDYDSGTIGGILMSVLDHAIETVDIIEDTDVERIVVFSMEIKDEIFEIIVENPTDKFKETEELLHHQDIALYVAKKLAKDCEGEVEIVCEEFYFTTTIRLPLSGLKKQAEGAEKC